MRRSDEARLAEQIEVACVSEATARKPGNVHPDAAFDDLTHESFVAAAKVVAPQLARAKDGVGLAIKRAVQASVDLTGTNVNLGICLLIAPLAAVPNKRWPNIAAVVDGLSVEDAIHAYAAIELASPGGLGETAEQDVRDRPTVSLLAAMTMAAERDGVAALYANRFGPLFDFALPQFLELLACHDAETAIVRLAVCWLAANPDTHIARRCGEPTATEASRRARQVVADWTLLEEFDRWLRADGHRRNPGTTADVVAATLFAAIRSSVEVESTLRDWLETGRRF